MKKINIRRTIYRIKQDYLNVNNAVILVAFIIAANWVWGSMVVMQKNFTLQKELDDKSRQLIVAQLDTENAKLEQRFYKTDEYKELAVRERLGLVTPGEGVLILPHNSQATLDLDRDFQNKSTINIPQTSNFNQWMNFLFGGNSNSMSK
ncbi:hypothetical protein HGB25_03565 [Candidatus Saccharibacteria bacterium]|nr:hypothetical protein [Candidatus Saccharibacteria bacterium]